MSSISDFFNSKLKSFDTETTSLDTDNKDFSKRGRIWQLGLATDGINGMEEHVNPFFINNNNRLEVAPKVSESFIRDKMKHSNGQFSLKAYEQGNFNTFVDLYNKNQLSSLNTVVDTMFSNIDLNDVVVLQNMNFENRVLKSSLDQGLLSPDVYTRVADRMNTVSVDSTGKPLHLFQRPRGVQEEMRQADMIYHTQYLAYGKNESFETYRQHVNKAMDEYSKVITDPNRKGAVAVELQDITKAFLANAASENYIDKRTATLGLNMDFLTKTILDQTEQHTALSDSNQTIDLFKKIWSMNSEIKSNTVSDSTRDILSKIQSSQGDEINKRFISTVRSTLNDITIKGHTTISNSLSWYSPYLQLREKTEDGFKLVAPLEKITTTGQEKEYSVVNALNNVVSRYAKFDDNFSGFNRKNYVSQIVEEFNMGASVGALHKRVDSDYFKPDLPKTVTTQENSIASGIRQSANSSTYWDETVQLFGKDMKRKTKATVLGGLGAGLAYMAFQSRPQPIQENYDNVSQQFYDDQYLGTAFVDFRERNKHYMM